MKTVQVALKSLREIVREPQLLGLTLLLPVIFMGLAAVSYGGSLAPTYAVWVIDRTAAEAGQLIERLADRRYADGRPVFSIQTVQDYALANEALKSGEATLLLILEPAAAPHSIPVEMRLVGDALSGKFYRASVLMEEGIRQLDLELSGRPERVRVVERSLSSRAASGPQTEFDLYAPGMIVFALLMIIPQTAMLVAREIRRDTLRRLLLARVSTSEFLGGVTLAQMAVALVQVSLVFAAALAMGFQNQGSLWLALLIGVIVSLSAIGLGLIVACFSENDSQAANVGSTVAMLQVFLSGSFYQLLPLTLFRVAGHQIDLFDVFPATHGFSALQQVLVYGADSSQVVFRCSSALILSLLHLGVGVWLFDRLQMRSRS